MANKNAVILGFGSYGKVFHTYLKEQGFNIIGFFDDNSKSLGRKVHGIEMLGHQEDLLTPEFRKKIDQVFCPIGDNKVRTRYLQELNDYGYETPNFIHDSVILNPDVVLGKGVYLLPGVIIMPHTAVEDFVIISMGSKIAHHTKIKRGAFISTGVNVGANVIIKSKAFLGISSTVMTGVEKVGKNSVIGCGAVVIRNVEDNYVVAGVPAKTLKVLEIQEEKKDAPNRNTPKKTTFEVITTKREWDNFLQEVDKYDSYHTYDYHMISTNSNEVPILLKYTEGDIIIGIPLLLRSISGTKYKDATSVYGYAGPISKGVSRKFDNTSFIKRMKDYFASENIISIFSRLNPFIPNQKAILRGFGTIDTQGKIVNIDLSLGADIQRQNYQSRLKTHVNKARRNCTVKKAMTDEEFQSFIDVYHENMDRVNAKSSYYFDERYFMGIAKSEDFETDTLLAVHNETKEVIAGSMFLKTNGIVQFHLSGTRNDFLRLSPSKLLIDEMRLKATELGYKYFNLGGGVEGSFNDSLFKFKSSFSKDYKNFDLWKLVINDNAYKELTSSKNDTDLDTNYFPLYRAPIK